MPLAYAHFHSVLTCYNIFPLCYESKLRHNTVWQCEKLQTTVSTFSNPAARSKSSRLRADEMLVCAVVGRRFS